MKKTRKKLKRRNPEKVVMDRHYHPKVFRSAKRKLEDQEVLKEMKELYND